MRKWWRIGLSAKQIGSIEAEAQSKPKRKPFAQMRTGLQRDWLFWIERGSSENNIGTRVCG